MKKYFLAFILIFLIRVITVFSYTPYQNYINYNEKFPNISYLSINQSLQNWWSTPFNNTKNIITPEGCRMVVSKNQNLFFIPTKTTKEWLSFVQNPPYWVEINLCYECGQNWLIANYPDRCIDDWWPNGSGDGIEFYCDANYVRACLTHEYCPWRLGKYTNIAPKSKQDRFGSYGDTAHNFTCWSSDLIKVYDFMKKYKYN